MVDCVKENDKFTRFCWSRAVVVENHRLFVKVKYCNDPNIED
jgi:hypothetical protein